MRGVSLFVILVFAACGGGSPFSADQLARMHLRFLDAHNAVRAAPEPAADPPIPALEHHGGLAGIAQAWAEGCAFEHSGNGYGENLAFFSGDESTPNTVVDAWAAEVTDFDYAANSCAEGKQCGHYTQIVWRTTTQVGCGVAQCNLEGFDGYLWVCNYNPAGNIVGVQPY